MLNQPRGRRVLKSTDAALGESAIPPEAGVLVLIAGHGSRERQTRLRAT